MCILVGLSLAETEIEYIHDHGDADLTQMLLSNRLLGTKPPPSSSSGAVAAAPVGDGYTNQLNKNDNNNNNNANTISVSDNSAVSGSSTTGTNSRDTNSDLLSSNGEFALFLTPPLSSFFLLISANFIYLLSFLGVLTYFVRLCEKADEDRKHMRSAETSRA
ncbi:unnamed protein product [Trichobilharzia regenti]|nr:unnamed protein product [Trichobilharzia regenti]